MARQLLSTALLILTASHNIQSAWTRSCGQQQSTKLPPLCQPATADELLDPEFLSELGVNVPTVLADLAPPLAPPTRIVVRHSQCIGYTSLSGLLQAVGDIHGDLSGALSVLRLAGLVDADGEWSGGDATLVQTGDLVDRGPDSLQVIQLMIKLHKQAAEAGGRVIQLLGNHEIMNLEGDLRYVHPEDVASFGGPEERAMALGASAPMGQWLRGRPVVAVHAASSTVYVHGGLRTHVAALGVTKINQLAEAELSSGVAGWLTQRADGPLWDRSLATTSEAWCSQQAKQALTLLGAERMVVGHTVTQSGAIETRCGGRVVMIDAGMNKVYGGARVALEIVSNSTTAVGAELSVGGRRELWVDHRHG